MPSKSRGGLSAREYKANQSGQPMPYSSVKTSSSSSTGLKAPTAPKTGSFKFDSSKLVPTYQAEAASIYNPQIQQIQGLQALTKAQAEDARVKTKDEFAQLLKREQENINRRGAFFSGGAIDQENRIGAQEGGALRDIGFNEQSANLQYQGTLSEIAQAQKDYVSSKVEGAYSSAYKMFQDKIANAMNNYQLQLGQYNTDRAFNQSKIESDRNYALSAAASGRAASSAAQGRLDDLLSRAAQKGEGGREWAVANAKTFGVNPEDVIRATYGTKEQPIDNWERIYNPNFGTQSFGDMTPSQQSGVNQIANKFETNPIVQRYNVAAEQKNYVSSLGKNPTDDMARVYAFAKVMDPDSAVREGEYSTVQDYSQALLQAYGLKAKRIFTNSGFLTDEARGYIEKTIGDREQSIRTQYDNVANEYGRRIEQVTGKTGGSAFLTDYAGAFNVNASQNNVQDVNDPLGIGL